jgi:hypothetical protein
VTDDFGHHPEPQGVAAWSWVLDIRRDGDVVAASAAAGTREPSAKRPAQQMEMGLLNGGRVVGIYRGMVDRGR